MFIQCYKCLMTGRSATRPVLLWSTTGRSATRPTARFGFYIDHCRVRDQDRVL